MKKGIRKLAEPAIGGLIEGGAIPLLKVLSAFSVLLCGYFAPPLKELYNTTFSIKAVYPILFIPPLIIITAVFIAKYRRYKNNAARDFMLGCYNQRECDEQLKRTVSEFRRKKGRVNFSILLCDLDGLKAANRISRAVGNTVLKEFAAILNEEKRATDLFYRYLQGDEFLFILRDTDAAGAHVFAERIRERTERHRFNNSEDLRITVCIGIKQLTADDVFGADRPVSGDEIPPETAVKSIVEKAESALAKAKNYPNKNRVEEYRENQPN